MNFISALLSLIGVLIVILLGESTINFSIWVLPIAAGGFIYIAVADMIPELHKTKDARHSFLQLFAVLAGIGAMFLLTLVE